MRIGRYLVIAWLLGTGLAAAQQPVETELPAAVALADNVANPTVPGVGAFLMCWDGSMWDRCPTSDGGSGAVTSNTTRVVTAENSLRRYISVGTTEDEFEVKATPGVLVGLSADNNHASANAFLKCANLTAANTTPGTSAIIYSIIIPWGGGVVDTDINAAFSTALTCWIVLGEADSDVAEVAANDVRVNLRYR